MALLRREPPGAEEGGAQNGRDDDSGRQFHFTLHRVRSGSCGIGSVRDGLTAALRSNTMTIEKAHGYWVLSEKAVMDVGKTSTRIAACGATGSCRHPGGRRSLDRQSPRPYFPLVPRRLLIGQAGSVAVPASRRLGDSHRRPPVF